MKPTKDPIVQLLSEFRELRQEIRSTGKRLLTIDEAAHFLGLCPKSIRNGLCPGVKKPFPVRPVRVAGRTLFRKEDLDKFCDTLAAE